MDSFMPMELLFHADGTFVSCRGNFCRPVVLCSSAAFYRPKASSRKPVFIIHKDNTGLSQKKAKKQKNKEEVVDKGI
mgnify:CR=1 FL=1